MLIPKGICSARRSGHAAAHLVYDDAGEPRRRSQPARMSKAGSNIALSRPPSARHGGRREIGHLGGKIGGIALMNEVEDRHRRVARLGETTADIDVAPQGGGKPLAEQRDPAAEIMRAAHRGDFPCCAADPTMGSGERIIAVDGKAQGVCRTRIIQRRNRYGAAAEELPVDRHRRQTRQRATGQYVVGAEHVPIIVEECLGSGRDVQRTEYHPHGPRIDPLEIDSLADQGLQFGDGQNRLLGPYRDRQGARNDIANLLRQHFDTSASDRGLMPFHFANGEVGWFFRDEQRP